MVTLTNAQVFDGRAMLPGRHDVTLDGTRIAVGQRAHRDPRRATWSTSAA